MNELDPYYNKSNRTTKRKLINEAWERGGDVGVGMQPARTKLASCQTQLASWSKRKFGNAAKMLKQKTKQLELLQRQARGSYLADLV